MFGGRLGRYCESVRSASSPREERLWAHGNTVDEGLVLAELSCGTAA